MAVWPIVPASESIGSVVQSRVVKDLRILHVVESFAPQAGSIAVAVRALRNALVRCGLDVRILARTGVADSGQDSVPVVYAAADLNEALGGCDLVHIHGWGDQTSLNAAKAARCGRIPYVISPYGAFSQGLGRRVGLFDRWRGVWRETRAVAGASLIGAVNQGERESLQRQRFRFAVEVMKPCLDFGAYAALETCPGLPDEPADGRVLLVLGAIDPMEGGVSLLKALAACGAAADGWQVVFAGPEVADWRKQMEAAVRRKGGADRVRFVRAPDVGAQRVWLARADALVCVARRSLCPTSVLQGLAARVPVLATPPVTPDGVGDYVVSCEPSRVAIEQGLRRLLTMTDEARRAMGRRARDAARRVCDADVVAVDYTKLYARVAGSIGSAATSLSVGAGQLEGV